MKTLSVLLLLGSTVVVSSVATAQISITTTDAQGWFAPGKSWNWLSNDSLISTTMNVGNASSSSSQLWTLPTVTYRDTSRSDNMAPSATPFASRFPTATHAQRLTYRESGVTYTFYQYFRIANDSLFHLGSAILSPSDTLFMQRNRFEVKFPFMLGSSLVSRDSTSFGPGSYSISNMTEVVDAYGSLTIPGKGTFQMLRSKMREINDVYLQGTLSSRDTSVSFSWTAKEGYLIDVEASNTKDTTGIIPIRGLNVTSITNTSVSVTGQLPGAPMEYTLFQNFPNPFNPSTKIQFAIPQAAFVTLKVYDLLGREVTTLVSERLSAGRYEVTFSATGARLPSVGQGSASGGDAGVLPSGVYFYRLRSGALVETRKLVLLK
ncbi:MAG: T9SS type A sorting domain-containing protein [Bacteroidota bacterium]